MAFRQDVWSRPEDVGRFVRVFGANSWHVRFNIPDGDKLKARFTVHYALSGKDSGFVSGVHGEQVVELTPAEFEEAMKGDLTYVVALNVARGKHTVALGVLDGISRASGFARVEVDLK